MIKMVLTVGLFLLSVGVHAGWLSTKGKVQSLVTYASHETVLVTLEDEQGEIIPGNGITDCTNKQSFAISRDISTEARARMYAALLAAKTAGTYVTISYSDAGGCEPWDASANVYRKVVRLW